jgi:hypothetical protein
VKIRAQFLNSHPLRRRRRTLSTHAQARLITGKWMFQRSCTPAEGRSGFQLSVCCPCPSLVCVLSNHIAQWLLICPKKFSQRPHRSRIENVLRPKAYVYFACSCLKSADLQASMPLSAPGRRSQRYREDPVAVASSSRLRVWVEMPAGARLLINKSARVQLR